MANGFELICDHRERTGDRVRLYADAGNANFVEVGAAEVAAVEKIVLPAPSDSIVVGDRPAPAAGRAGLKNADLTSAELRELLSSAGARHNLDANLLASVVRAESGGRAAAVSKKGARGLMQLMPKTAAELGVGDSFQPEENVAGGATYLDWLLTRYRDNLALALAAYNAGPAAVDRCGCVPAYRETRLYVARIIRDFNASVKAAARNSNARPTVLGAAASRSEAAAGSVARANSVLTGATAP